MSDVAMTFFQALAVAGPVLCGLEFLRLRNQRKKDGWEDRKALTEY